MVEKAPVEVSTKSRLSPRSWSGEHHEYTVKDNSTVIVKAPVGGLEVTVDCLDGFIEELIEIRNILKQR